VLSVGEAKQRILRALPRLPAETAAIDQACGRILAAKVTATRRLPPFDSSAMDGFAVRAKDVPGTLPIAGAVAAGATPTARLAPGTTLRIMTGAPLPDGADAVVIREDVEDLGDQARFAEPAARGANIREAGEDVAVGDTVLPAGARLDAGEVGLLAALGHAQLTVGRRPKVAILSTGDELCDVGVEPRPGQIVNSNAYALAAQVREAGGLAVALGIAPDDRAALVAKLREGLAADALVTSGGVSVGDHDYVKEALESLGVRVDFWKVAMKPGKPLLFGLGPDSAPTPVFALPGNPVSSMVGCELFVRPALLAMQGATEIDRPLAPVRMQSAYRKQPGRAHYVRAALERRGDELWARISGSQGSNRLRSMVGVDALVEVPAGRGDVVAGERLDAILLRPR
jgi:molybdopterin molybdotransferase